MSALNLSQWVQQPGSLHKHNDFELTVEKGCLRARLSSENILNTAYPKNYIEFSKYIMVLPPSTVVHPLASHTVSPSASQNWGHATCL